MPAERVNRGKFWWLSKKTKGNWRKFRLKSLLSSKNRKTKSKTRLNWNIFKESWRSFESKLRFFAFRCLKVEICKYMLDYVWWFIRQNQSLEWKVSQFRVKVWIVPHFATQILKVNLKNWQKLLWKRRIFEFLYDFS